MLETGIMDAGFALAALIALFAGVLSFLSPCVLPIVPPYLAYMGGISMGEMQDERAARRRTLAAAGFFVLGLSTVFLFLGFTASAFGQFFLRNQTWFATLAGVVVMFYLLIALRAALRARDWFGPGRPEPNLGNYLDLVALGTVADLVPLDHNNRVLVRQGLERIRRAQARPGLMALLRAGKRDYRYVSASDLGFAVGPRLNAAGRLEDMSAGIRCLLSEDREEAMSLAAELDDLNRQRRAMQDRMQDEAMHQVSGLLDELDRTDLPEALCLFDERWHQGVVGLVASRIKDAVHRPVVAFAPEQEGADVLKGSARSVRGLHIRDTLALVEARNPGLVAAFGGHAMAAGLSLERNRLEHFREALSEAVLTMLDGDVLTQEILTDGELRGGELGLETALAIEQFGPWGQRFPEPLFDGRFDVVDRYIVGGAHLKMVVKEHGGDACLDAIAFNRLPEDLPASGPVRLLYRLGVNRWQGAESPQLLVEFINP